MRVGSVLRSFGNRVTSSRHVVRSGRTTEVSLRHNQLGASDLSVSEICMGTMTFGNHNTEKEAFEILSCAWDNGINFLDTAEMYPFRATRETQGLTSTYVGNWMKTRRRDDVIVASKVSGNSEDDVSWVPRSRPNSDGKDSITVVNAESIAAACEGELLRLQTDYLDLFQIHWPDRYVALWGVTGYNQDEERESYSFEEQVQAMGDLIAAGKIRHWGLSNETPYGVIMMCLAADKLGVARPVSLQNRYSLLDRRFEYDLAEVCSKRHCNVSLLPWGAAAGGRLSGKYLDGGAPPGARHSDSSDDKSRYPKVYPAIAEYMKIAKSAGVTPMQLAYAFCRSNQLIPSVIIGATSTSQLEENIQAFAMNLTEETLEEIDRIHMLYTNPMTVV